MDYSTLDSGFGRNVFITWKVLLKGLNFFRKKCLFVIVVGIGIQVSSCVEIIEIELPGLETKPIVNCLFSTNEPFKLHISLPKDPTDTIIYHVSNADVEIEGDDGTTIILEYTGEGLYTNGTILPNSGVLYTLNVNLSGFEKVTATASIPFSETKVISVGSKSDIKISPVMGTGEEASIKVQKIEAVFTNDNNIDEFFGVSIIKNYIHYSRLDVVVEEDDRFQIGYLDSDDPSIIIEGLENYEPALYLFKDGLFTEETATVSFNFEKNTTSKFWFKFFQFSPGAYQYIKTWMIHDYTKDYDFWEVYEPLPLYSNIENGYGIFAGYSLQQFEVYPDSTQTFN
jgi:hypothetical protein